MKTDALISMRQSVFYFALNEALTVHKLMDGEGVARHHDGEKLSLSQRVELYVKARRIAGS